MFVLALALWIAYNVVRWGVPWDAGHTIFFHQDSAGSPIGSPFGFGHIGYQLSSFFVVHPTITDHAPWLVPEYGGVAFTWTSPALVIALLARRPPGRRGDVDCRRADRGPQSALLRERDGAIRDAPWVRLRAVPRRADGAGRSRADAGVGRRPHRVLGWRGLWGVWFWNAFYRPGYRWLGRAD